MPVPRLLTFDGANHYSLDKILLNKGVDEEDGKGRYDNGRIFYIFRHEHVGAHGAV